MPRAANSSRKPGSLPAVAAIVIEARPSIMQRLGAKQDCACANIRRRFGIISDFLRVALDCSFRYHVINVEMLWRKKSPARATHQLISIHDLRDVLCQVTLHFLPKRLFQRRHVNVRHGDRSPVASRPHSWKRNHRDISISISPLVNGDTPLGPAVAHPPSPHQGPRTSGIGRNVRSHVRSSGLRPIFIAGASTTYSNVD